jgi:tetratricopeptide (TPR) repeat protein
MLQQSTLDLPSTEDRLRAVLATAPDNIFAMRLLWSLLQSAGRSHDALATVQRAIALKPLAASNNYPLGQLLWIAGRTAEADRIIDRAIQYWPAHRYVRFARFTIFAFTGRPRAAGAMLDSADTRPQNFSPASVALWRISLAALDQPSPANVAAARQANLDAVKRDPKLTSQAVLTLSALGEVDAAFEIANDLLVFLAPKGTAPQIGAKTPMAGSTAWRFTPWLFTPPAAAMRADARFAALCDGIGFTAYWLKRGIKPDYQRY